MIEKNYIKRVATPNWNELPVFAVEEYVWGGAYRPATWAQMAVVENEGLRVRMTTQEANPRAVYTQNYDPVYKDSCMECFINFAPENETAGYLNCEVNANGAILLGYGVGREERATLPELGLPVPVVRIEKTADAWSCEYTIPMETIRTIFGIAGLEAGRVVKVNFYKCGDDTAVPHFGSWAPITAAGPDFHRPECFQSLVIE